MTFYAPENAKKHIMSNKRFNLPISPDEFARYDVM